MGDHGVIEEKVMRCIAMSAALPRSVQLKVRHCYLHSICTEGQEAQIDWALLVRHQMEQAVAEDTPYFKAKR